MMMHGAEIFDVPARERRRDQSRGINGVLRDERRIAALKAQGAIILGIHGLQSETARSLKGS